MASRRFITNITSVTAPKLSKTISNASQLHQPRILTSNGMLAVERLRDALETYRQTHYQRELPSRFKKDILNAAMQDDSERVGVEGLHRVIQNIGVQHKVSREDVEIIFSEISEGEQGYIPTEQMLQMF